MTLVTIPEASKLVGKSKQTLYRHVRMGMLSRGADTLIDTAELIRVYGELKQIETVTPSKVTHNMQRPVTGEFAALRAHIDTLQNDLSEVKQALEQQRVDGVEREKSGIEREKRLMALLEHKKEGNSGLFSKLFK
nr:hypothetical protein [Rhodospirillales bacterium]